MLSNKEKKIPKNTFYCYSVLTGKKAEKFKKKYGASSYPTKLCPYWKIKKKTRRRLKQYWYQEVQNYGKFWYAPGLTVDEAVDKMMADDELDVMYYCAYCKEYDFAGSLLWDQCKECGVSDDIIEEEENI